VETDAVKRLKRKLTIETLWIYVIAVLKKHGALHGYGVKKRIKEEFYFNPATITTYTVLYRMEREGLIEKAESNTYKVTEKGIKEYEKAKQFIKNTLEALP